MLNPEQQSEAINIAAEILGKAHHDVAVSASAGDGSHVVATVSVVFILEKDGSKAHLSGKAILMDPATPRRQVGIELMKLGLNMTGSPLADLFDASTKSERLMEVVISSPKKDGSP
jgi:hypothetical protein